MFLFLIAQTAAEGIAVDGDICEIPSLAALVVWSPCSLFTCFWETGSCTSVAGMLSSWLGWVSYSVLALHPRLFSLGAELLWSSLGWRLSLSRSLLLNSLPLCCRGLVLFGYTFALSRYKVNGQLSSSLDKAPNVLTEVACYLSVWRKR